MRRPTCWLSLLTLLLCAPEITAGQSDRPTGSGRGRTLGGHLFIPSSPFPDPFVASYLRSLIGAGFATDLQVPIYDISDSVVRTLQGDAAFIELDLEYQQQLGPWLAVRVSGSGLARSGTETPTLLSEGLAAVYGVGLGATARIWANERFVVSAALDHRSNQLFGVTPLEYVQAVGQGIGRVLDSLAAIGGVTIDSALVDSVLGAIDLEGYSMFDDDAIQATTGGVRAAFVPAPWIGLTALLQTGITGIFSGVDDQGLVDVGAAASVDLLPLGRVPVGFSVSGRWRSASDRGSNVAKSFTTVALGLAYTGRSDFTVALEAVFATFEQRDVDASTTAKRFGLAMRYYF